MRIVLDLSDLREYERKLKSMKKYDFPLAVRGTLNDAAFLMKQKKIQPEFEENFTVRRRTFIKAFTGATRSKNTFDIKQMYSQAGVYRGKRNQEVGERLKLQEFGGGITDRAVPRVTTRKGNSYDKVQKGSLFYRRFKKLGRGKTAIMGTDEDGVIKRTKKGHIIHMDRDKSRKPIYKLLYLHRNRVRIKKSKFIKPAALATQREMPRLFIENAQKRFKKAMK